MNEDPWETLAPLYDWEHADFDADLRFYLALARESGDPVLDVGCGTGRVLEPLLRVGLRVTGIDRSPAMLQRASQRLERMGEAGGRGRLVLGDVRDVDLGSRYALAIVALDGFGLLVERRDQLSALANLWRHLRRGGLLALDLANGNVRGGEPREELRHHFTRPHPEHGRPLTKWVARRSDPAAQVDELVYMYDELDAQGALRRVVARHALRYFTRAEIELLLERCGFRLRGVYGGYGFEPFDADSERLIVLACRPETG